MYPNISDIAKKLNLSFSTVNNCFQGLKRSKEIPFNFTSTCCCTTFCMAECNERESAHRSNTAANHKSDSI